MAAGAVAEVSALKGDAMATNTQKLRVVFIRTSGRGIGMTVA
jgi:hypothetical protein